jgi:alpha-1,3-rhamnosyl/mannosyltransferase
VATLVQAFARLVAAGQAGDHRLALAGPTGWLSDDLLPATVIQAVGGDGPQGRLRRLGPLPEAELRALYAGATLLALPSRHEGFGLPLLEAMVQGTPVVASDIPALQEVTDGAARLVPPDDVDAWVAALAEVIADEGLRRRLAEAGRARAATFSWERTVRDTRAVYSEALGGAR